MNRKINVVIEKLISNILWSTLGINKIVNNITKLKYIEFVRFESCIESEALK